MKKLLKIFSFSFILLALFSSFSTALNCIEKTLGDNSICVGIDKESSNRYTLNRNVNCNSSSCAVSCDILLPDNTLTHVGACNGTFRYNSSSREKVKLYITINDESDTIAEYYDFGDGSWEGNGGGGSSNNGELEISTDDKNPSISEYVDIKIDTDDDYVGKVYLTAKYRSSTSNSWTTISNTSSTYFSNRSTDWSNGYISLTSSNNGHKNLSNAFKFAKKGYYRIIAKDEDGDTDYIDFNVDEYSNSNDELEISTDDKNPSVSEYVDLDINTDSDYVGRVFLTAKYRSSTSNSWTTISNTSSTYFSNRSTDWSNGYVSLTSSNNGHKELTNAFKFVKKGYYRITARDQDGNTDYIDFNVDASSSNDDIEVSASPSNPDTFEWVKLNINTDSSYVGKLSFSKFQYRSSSSSSWSTISSRTNSTYVSDYSSTWSDGYYRMTSSDRGSVSLKNLIKFKKSGYYRIYVKDDNGNEDYVQISVDASSSNDDIEISASPSNPDTYEWVKLNINTDSSYVGKLSFSKFQYRSSSSSSWSTISSRTNSTYVSDYSSTWSDGYYRLTSSDRGSVSLKNLIKFKKSGYYRIYVKDDNGNENYVQISVDASSSSNDIELETNDDSPLASEYVDLTVETHSSYRGKINFSAKYRSSTSNSWANITRTNSTYFLNTSTTWKNGYINMTSSDGGEKTVKNIFKFAKKGYYRIVAEDEDGNSTYLDFNVGYADSEPLDGFTRKEFEMIERIYNVWPTLISKLKSEYSKLRNNTSWKNLSDQLYKNMRDVVNKKSNREFQDYDDFDNAFRYWFNRTQNLIY